MTSRDDRDLRDRCCWRRCRMESDIIFLGFGLCDKHYATALSAHLMNAPLAGLIPAADRLYRGAKGGRA